MTAEAGPPVRANVLEERVLYVDGIRRGNRALHAASIRERQLIELEVRLRWSGRLSSERQRLVAAERKHRLDCFLGVHRLPLTQLVRKKAKTCRGADRSGWEGFILRYGQTDLFHLVLTWFCNGQPSSARDAQDVRELTSGASVERELASGTSDTFRLDAQRRRFPPHHIVQRGIHGRRRRCRARMAVSCRR